MDGYAWIDSLPAELAGQREVLRRLLAAIERDSRWRWLELACSVAAGRGDTLSDLDLGLGVDPAAWPEVLAGVPALVGGLGEVIDLLRHRIPEWGDAEHQRTFVQYANGVQLDLVVVPARQAVGTVPGAVMLYDATGLRAGVAEPSVMRANSDTIREWIFLGWTALADLDKYLRRGSLWEAMERLQQARLQVWRLWAVLHGVDYPVFGLTSVLDHPEVGSPPGIERTVAMLDGDDLRRAALACAQLLEQTGQSAAAMGPTELPLAFARYVRTKLESIKGGRT